MCEGSAMNWLIWVIIIVFALFIIFIIARKIFKKEEDYINLDSRLEGVKGKFSDCCKKILGRFGI